MRNEIRSLHTDAVLSDRETNHRPSRARTQRRKRTLPRKKKEEKKGFQIEITWLMLFLRIFPPPHLSGSSQTGSTSSADTRRSFSAAVCRWCSRCGWHTGGSVYLGTQEKVLNHIGIILSTPPPPRFYSGQQHVGVFFTDNKSLPSTASGQCAPADTGEWVRD